MHRVPKKTPKSFAQFCFLLSLQAGYLQTTYFILGGLGTRKRQESQTPLQFRFAIQDLGEGRERHLLHILSVWQSNPAENWQIHSFKYSTVFTKKKSIPQHRGEARGSDTCAVWHCTRTRDSHHPLRQWHRLIANVLQITPPTTRVRLLHRINQANISLSALCTAPHVRLFQ